MTVVQRVAPSDNEEETLNEMHKLFNEQGYSDYVVVYLRLITSGQLQEGVDFYQNFIDGNCTMEEFRHQEVEPMYKESDHIHIIGRWRPHPCSEINQLTTFHFRYCSFVFGIEHWCTRRVHGPWRSRWWTSESARFSRRTEAESISSIQTRSLWHFVSAVIAPSVSHHEIRLTQMHRMPTFVIYVNLWIRI